MTQIDLWPECCQCGHEKEEHRDSDHRFCDGVVEDQGFNIGCYCAGFKERTVEWLDWQDKHRFDDYKPPHTLWGKLRKLIGF